MNQSSALRQLEIILEQAMTRADNAQTGLILMQAMQLPETPCNLVSFFTLLHKAKEEAKRLNYPKVDRDIAAIEDLQTIFSENHAWGHPWSVFSGRIKTSNILSLLNNLANSYHNQSNNLFLEEDFLQNLDNDFSSLLREVIDSELPKTLKKEIKIKIEDLLCCIRNYSIDGTEGIEKALQSLVVQLEIGDKSTSQKTCSPVLKNLKVAAFSLLLFLRPGFWDVAGLLPDIESFWVPKFHELVEFRQKIELHIDEDSSIKSICGKITGTNHQKRKLPPGKLAKTLPPEKSTKKLSPGKSVKSLPPGKED
ncbi:MAG: hypothetical protein MH252_09610 [Thermosynechococcaceae cyanobacterium MS004]|nr:hypothetical protein [Thermosynechococcaceae cyanobacterium MS004]